MRASRALEREMDIMGRHWLDYDPVALAALIIGIGIVESLALVRSPMIRPGRRVMVIRSRPSIRGVSCNGLGPVTSNNC